MGKFRVFLLIVFFVFILSFPVSAQSVATPSAESALRHSVMRVASPAAQKVNIQEKIAERKALVQQKREEFKQRLQTVRDETKKNILERVEQRMNNLNERVVERFLKHLERLEKILGKIETRAKKKEEQGGNLSSVYNLINIVRGKIDDLKNSLTEQAAKDYTPTLASEETLGTEISQLHQQLRSDIQALRESLVEIRKDTAEIIKILGNVKIEKQEATSAANSVSQ